MQDGHPPADPPGDDTAGSETGTGSELSFEQALEGLESIVDRLEQGDLELEAALAHLERSAELDREQPLTYRSLGAAYEQVGRSQEAISSFERYLDLAGDPVDAEQVRTTIALLRRSLRNEPERLGNRVDGGNPSSDGLRTKRSGSPRPAAP